VNRDLKILLDGLAAGVDESFLSLDPLGIVRRYEAPEDREAAGWFAAMLAIGRADLIRKAVSEVLDAMGPSPARFLRRFEPARDGVRFKGFVYRFFRERDLVSASFLAREMMTGHGSIGTFFERGYRPFDNDTGPALTAFVRSFADMGAPVTAAAGLAPGTGLRAFLADPADGSACKRLNLFLRWMVRTRSPDLGLWPGIPASKLMIPLDTHLARFGRRLGLTTRSSADWKMAAELTESLRRFDPEDPVKYDFALCTIGKLQACPESQDAAACGACPLVRFCVLHRAKAAA
jgi:uncharacterized protein (TIGR02757 family)